MSEPRTWHGAPWRQLQGRRERDAMAHALLVCGATGLGKRDFATAFVNGLLCQQPDDGWPCGRCRSCALLAAGTHPDLVQLALGLRKDGSPRSEIVVEQIRVLSARLAMSSQFGGWQVAIIDPADAMNAAAANALLKTLEEPATQTLLVLLADAPWRLPQTIRSRCQQIAFDVPPVSQALDWLQREGVADPADALVAAGGNPGLAKSWAEQGALIRRREVRHDLAALAGGRGEPLETCRRWLEGDPAQCLWFAAQAAADEARARATGGTGPLSSRMETGPLMGWYAQANQAREALRGPLRSDLVMLDLLGRWR